MALDGPEEARCCCCELGLPDAVKIAVATCLLLFVLVGSGIVCIGLEGTFGAAPMFADSLIVDDLFAKGSLQLFLAVAVAVAVAVVACRVTCVVSRFFETAPESLVGGTF
jgi:hypothetical protein